MGGTGWGKWGEKEAESWAKSQEAAAWASRAVLAQPSTLWGTGALPGGPTQHPH